MESVECLVAAVVGDFESEEGCLVCLDRVCESITSWASSRALRAALVWVSRSGVPEFCPRCFNGQLAVGGRCQPRTLQLLEGGRPATGSVVVVVASV